MRGPTSASTTGSTAPFDNCQALFHPRYEIFWTMGRSARDALRRSFGGVPGDVSGVALNLANRFGNFVHVVFVAEQGELGNPHSLPGRTLGVREGLLQERMWLGSLRPAQALAIFAITEAVEFVQRRITGLRRDSLSIQGGDKVLGRDAGELLRIHMEDVGVLAVTGAARVADLRRDSGNFAQQFVEQAPAAVSMQGLFLQAPELHFEHGALPFAQPVVRSKNEVAVEPFFRHASAIVEDRK